MTEESSFKYRTDIHLPKKPLVEAWLELRWRTADTVPLDPILPPVGPVDSNSQLAPGIFYERVRGRYGIHEPLPTAQIPVELTPHQVAHRFRQIGSPYPLLQLGPGVASVNFVQEYSWTAFRGEALYLRKNLLDAYRQHDLVLLDVILRYRDLFGFDFRGEDVVKFLSDKLHIGLSWPTSIPGHVAAKPFPTSVGLNLGFELQTPPAVGSVRVATAINTTESGVVRPVILAEFEVRAREVTSDLLLDEERFTTWMDNAHAAVHDWFFSLIDGDLFQEFNTGGL